MQFSTLNESKLHNSLKTLYAETYNGKMEVEQDGHIYDIVCNDGTVIEIQTANLSKLLPKLEDALSKGHKITLVHPIVITRKILLLNENGEQISKRKSPKKGSIYDVFKELTKIYKLLLNPDFTLDLVKVNIIEERISFSEPVQSHNNKRRFRKNWQKNDKILEEILEKISLNGSKDYLNLLPENLPEEFCAKDLSRELLSNPELPASAAKQAHLIMWVLKRMNLLIETKTVKRSKYYRKVQIN